MVWLRLEEATQRRRLAEAEVDRLALELMADGWAAEKDRFIPAAAQ